MKLSDLPKPSPDFTRLRKVLTGEAPPDRLPLVELLADQEIKEMILGRPSVSDFTNDPDDIRRRIDDEIEFRYKLGYDYIDVCPFAYFGASYQVSDRIAILGGVDMDLLTRGSEQEVRTRVREIIATCSPSGRFALGTGNSVASYLNLDNYLAMLEEARRK